VPSISGTPNHKKSPRRNCLEINTITAGAVKVDRLVERKETKTRKKKEIIFQYTIEMNDNNQHLCNVL
jgi:hypothetical protein